MDAELVFNAAHQQPRAAFADEHGQAAAVLGALFGAGQHQVDFGAAVGDEPLHAVEEPPVGVLVETCLELDRLEVGAGFGLGEGHGPVHLAGAKAGKMERLLFVRGEFTEGFGDVLEAEQVLQGRVGAGDHFGHHGIDGDREIKAAVLARQHDAEDLGFSQILKVFLGALGVGNHAVLQLATFLINLGGPRGDVLAADFADHGQHLVVAVQGVGQIHRRLGKAFGLPVVVFAITDDLVQADRGQVELEVGIVAVEIFRHV